MCLPLLKNRFLHLLCSQGHCFIIPLLKMSFLLLCVVFLCMNVLEWLGHLFFIFFIKCQQCQFTKLPQLVISTMHVLGRTFSLVPQYCRVFPSPQLFDFSYFMLQVLACLCLLISLFFYYYYRCLIHLCNYRIFYYSQREIVE